MTAPAKGLLIHLVYFCLTLPSVRGLSECANLNRTFPTCSCSEALDSQGQATQQPLVDCSSRNLTQVPVPATPYAGVIYELRLLGNSITSLGGDMLRNLTIKKLDLRGNSIAVTNDNAFRALGPGLTALYMDGNSSSQPPVKAFSVLRNVEELILRNFKVEHLGFNNTFIFLPFVKLKGLTLDNWGIQSIDVYSFQGPTSLSSLSLLNQPLPHIPIEVFQASHSPSLLSLRKLRISYTPINVVTPYVFRDLDYLEELDLGSNHIDTLESNCFQGIGDTLLRLALWNNSLTNDIIKLAGLNGPLSNLEVLNISYNSFTGIPNLSSLATAKPLKLSLNNNMIRQLPDNSFSGFADKLHTLELSRNTLASYAPNCFQGVSKLQVLYLSEQTLRPSSPLVLPTSLAQSKATLTQLYLSGQPVNPSSLWSLVGQLSMLKVLDVAKTELSSIPDLALANLTSLEQLVLTGNVLSAITQAALVGPRNSLKYLLLSDTRISTLPACLFQQYTSHPITMALQNSALICNCSLKWLWSSIKNNTIRFIPGHEAKCTNGAQLASLQESDICPVHTSSPETQCTEYYTPPTIFVKLTPTDAVSITVSWSLSKDAVDLTSFKVEVISSNSQSEFAKDLAPSTRQFLVKGLNPNITHDVCVTAYFLSIKPVTSCEQIRPQDINTTDQQNSSGSKDIAIIIGAVLGSVALLAIIAVIIYLVLIRKRPKKNEANDVVIAQPRNFTKAELPSMNTETRTFAKAKKPATRGEGMQVVAISDGQTSGGRVGRAHLLNSDSSYQDMNSKRPSSGSASPPPFYENGWGSLPPTSPNGKSYYNMGFSDEWHDEPREVTV